MAFLAAVSGRGMTLVEDTAEWRWRKATAEASVPDTTAWRERAFDDSGWLTGKAPFFYGEDLTGTALADMRGGYTGVYLRRRFSVADPAALSGLRLRVLSDDGFVAWINGRMVARFNVPEGEIPFSGTAAGTFNEPLPLETYEVPGFRDVLVAGENVLTVHALNASLAGSSDFVLQLALEADVDDAAPVLVSASPPDGARVRELAQATVVFSEPVDGVDAGDLRVNGAGASRVTAFGEEQFVFEFPAAGAGTVSFEWAADHRITDRSPARNAFAGGGWRCTVDPNLPVPGVWISEFLTDNDRTLNDEDGDASDWVEIENASEETVDLGGWGLTDTPADLFRWRFPAVSLGPRSRLIVFASGKDRREVGGRLHANFALGRSGGYLALVRPGGEVASAFIDYPAQLEDVSFGRMPTDPERVGYFPQPTPGAPNAEGGPGFAPEVGFSRIGGTFLSPFLLSLTTPDPAATIRYTLDGSVPGEASTAYTGPLRVAASTRVRARAYVPGLLPGPLGAEYYVQVNPSAAGVQSTLPLVILHSFGRGAVPASGEYPAFLTIQEPRGGASTLVDAPGLRTRVKLNIRGSSTQGLPKRSYRIEFRDEREADRKLSPLGMPAESDWILYAPNNFEPILIHNPLMYGLSNELGRYAPRTRMVELYIVTGTGPVASTAYAGIYVLMEKIKRGADRVDIENLEPEHTTVPSVTGGYLLKIDRLDPGDTGLSAGGQLIGYVDPKEEEMRLPQRAAQRTYLRNHLNAFASALNGANWRDPLLGWRPYIDEGAWIDHHLLNVVAFNVDALRLSAYFHKPRGGPLVFGPLWDFDRSLNSTDGRDANPRVWANSGGTDFFNYPWWNRLFRDPDFWQHWVDRYQDLRRGTLGTNHLFAAIDRWTDEVRPAQPREAARWPGFTTPRGSYQGEIDALKTWLSRRLHFMDTNFLAAAVMEPSAGRVAVGTSVRLNGPPGATVYYTLDGSDPRAPGGAVAAGARVYSQPLRIEGAGTVRARAYHAGHRNRTGSLAPPISTSWSGLTEARYGILPTPGPGTLRLTEIHYRPAAPDSRELAAIPGVTRGDFEFVELRSFGSEVVDLHGVRFTEGIAFDFSASAVSVLAPGERLVLVRHRAAFELRYGTVTNLAGVYSGALAAAGEVLAWEDAAGNRLGTTAFRPALFPATDGLGFSLVAADDGAGSIPGDEAWGWRPSARLGGSPGAPEPEGTGIPAVRIHEVLSHPGPGQRDGLELHHPGPGPADVGGWFLTDDPDQPRKFRIPDGTILPAGGYLWIDATQFGPGGNPGTPFGFNAAGEAAWLFAADATGNLLGYAHGFAFGAAPAGVSFGRETTCDGRELFVAQRRVTPGAPNPGPLRPSVVISEIHYHPPDIRLGVERLNDTAMEFLELTNTGDEPVRLFDPEVPQLTWRLRDAVDFVFPAAVVLPPGRSLLVVNFDPETNPQARARFTAAFGISLEVPLYGPYGGSLPNSAGRVELVRPDPPQGTVNPAPDTLRWVVVDAVGYEDRGSWGAEADGGGGSLQRLDLTALGDRPGAWRAAPPTPGQVAGAGADADGDGLPDAWEAAHCLDPDDPADAAEDADGDGASNAAEFLAGTHPQSADSVLAWSEVAADGGGVTLRFTAMPGREYVVEGRESVATGGWQTLWTVPARTEAGQVEVREAWTGQAGATRFYRIRLVRVPD